MTDQRETEDREPFVTVFQSSAISAEMEAQAVHALLESSGIESVLVRENVLELPVGNVEVKVVASDAERAEQIIREGQQAGPAAAEEAEAETEL